jgi:multidrug efflux pump
MIEDRGDLGPTALQDAVEHLTRLGNRVTEDDAKRMIELTGRPEPIIAGLFSVFRANVPQLHIRPNKAAVMGKGVRLQDFADTLNIYQGSLYVNDFNLFGRTWQVIVQSEGHFRDRIDQLYHLSVRNQDGNMVPIGSLAEVSGINGPLVITRYNMRPAASINGLALPGISSGQATDLMQRIAEEELPQSMAYEWTDMSYLEQLAGSTAMWLFAFAVVMVFLVLAAQYESWSLPLAVILVVPMCLLSAVAGVKIAGTDINIFTQIGFVVLVGLASKNAILIVEFAKRQHEAGSPRDQAALEACRLRLRPILMTSLAFILGVVPLIRSSGAGAEMRQTLGTAVFSGMLGVTLFGLFLTPVFFFVIDRLSASRHEVVHVPARVRTAVLWSLVRGAQHLRTFVTPRPRRPVPGSSPHVRPATTANGKGNGAAADTAAAPVPLEPQKHK